MRRYTPNFFSENEAILRMINDSCKVIVMCRDLTVAERKQFESRNIFPISTKIAEDAIAFVINNQNTDTVFTVEKIKSILVGKDTLWNQINKQSKLGKIDIVFDNKGSANTSYHLHFLAEKIFLKIKQ